MVAEVEHGHKALLDAAAVVQAGERRQRANGKTDGARPEHGGGPAQLRQAVPRGGEGSGPARAQAVAEHGGVRALQQLAVGLGLGLERGAW